MTKNIDAVIVGAEKAGTSALGYYLSMHPDVVSHFDGDKRKMMLEFSSFVNGRCLDEKAFSSDYDFAFGDSISHDKTVVAKNVSIVNSDFGLGNLKKLYPDCKLIMIVRNPIDRAFSSFFYQKFRGEEVLESFEDAVERELNSEPESLSIEKRYLARGYYASQLENIYRFFDKEHVLVLLYEDMKNCPEGLMDKVFTYLGLTPCVSLQYEKINEAQTPRSKWLARYIHAGGLLKSIFRQVTTTAFRYRLIMLLRRLNSRPAVRQEMDKRLRDDLLKHFSIENEKLANLTGFNLQEWQK